MSTREFLLPDVGEGLTEAEIVVWKVAVGDTIALNQPLIDIETAKATVELPSPYAGVVTKLHGEVGDVVPVGAPLIEIEVGGGDAAPLATPAEPATTPQGEGRTAVLVGYGVATNEGAPTRHRRRGGAVAPAPAPPAPITSTAPALAPRSTPPVR